MTTITQTIKVDMTYEQPTITPSLVSRLLGRLSRIDFSDYQAFEFYQQHGFYVPWDTINGIRDGRNLIHRINSRNRDVLEHRDWGYVVERDDSLWGAKKDTRVTVWYYKHPDLASCTPEIEFISHYLSEKHDFVVSEPTYETEEEERYNFQTRRQEMVRVPKKHSRWAYVYVSEKPIVDGHPDGCPCGLHD